MHVDVQHNLKRYITAVVGVLISIVLGLALAAIVATEMHGYVAGYTWFFLLLVAGSISFIMLTLGILLVFHNKLKLMGAVLVVSSVLLPVSYLVGVKTFEIVGWSRYVHEQMVKFGPDVRASLVVIYKKSATDEQIGSFLQEKLSRPHPEGKGYSHLDGTSSVGRLNIHGHVATDITFKANATEEQRDSIKAAIYSSPIVYKIMEDVIPSEIEAIEETPPSNNGLKLRAR